MQRFPFGSSSRRQVRLCCRWLPAAVALALAVFAAPASLRAISVLAPSFDELVAESGNIVRGRVIAVEPYRTTSRNGTPIIKTRVTWQVERPIKGDAMETLTLDFLGGSVDGDSLKVGGMPEFTTGETDYLFVDPDTRVICPLIAAGHGRYRVLRDAGTGHEYIARDNGAPLGGVSDVSAPLHAKAEAAAGSPARAMTPDEFEAQILRSLASAGASHAK